MPQIDLGQVVGPQGAQGEPGPQGAQGIQGPAGPAATINGVNALTIEAGDNIELSQSGSTTTLSVPTDAAPTEDSTKPVQSGGVAAALNNKPNRNLLDNWYFVGGGSQQGGGQFPINQRGETSYTSPGYIIDRWDTSNGSVTLSADCIKITNANNIEALWWIRQLFEQDRFLVGTTLTVSALVKVSPSTPFEVVLQTTQTTAWSGFAYAPKTGKYELVSYTTTLAETPVWSVGFGLVTHAGANTGNADFIEVKALKVEFGPTQTLAHQDEDGNWVLNEIPDYGEELAKCQRYFQQFTQNAGSGIVYNNTTAFVIFPLSVPMRAVPAIIKQSPLGDVWTSKGSTTISDITINVTSNADTTICINVVGDFSGIAPGEVVTTDLLAFYATAEL